MAQSYHLGRRGLRLKTLGSGILLAAALMIGMAAEPAFSLTPSATTAQKTAPKPVAKPATTPLTNAAATSARKKPVVAKPGTAKPPTVTERVFAHLKSDLPLDPSTHLGRLPNGMTYVIYPNKTPEGAVSIRLRVEVGGINEGAADQGIAHFLEHMAFQGSTHIAEGELVHMLERHGLKFGADTNAFTTTNSTFYQLDLPRADADSLDTALLIMSDTAQGLTLDQGAVDHEREVVLSEMRTRDTPARRAYRARLTTLLAGQAYADHEVIGTRDSLKAITSTQLRRFYQTWYRPERTTLVIAGDVDPKNVEAMIRAKFSGWKAQAAAPPLVKYGSYKPKGMTLSSYVSAGLSPSITMSWFQPYKETIETRDDFKTSLMDVLISRIILRRLGMVNTRDAPYESINFGREAFVHGATGLTVEMQPKSGQQTYAITRAYEALQQFSAYGDTETYRVDFDDAVASLNLSLKRSAGMQDTRNSSSIASSILADIDGAGVMMSPAQAYAQWKTVLPEIGPAQLKARLNQWLSKDGPIIFHRGDTPSEIVEANLREHWSMAALLPVSMPPRFIKSDWPYKTIGQDLGLPSALVKQEEDKVLGFTRLTYANGLKVNIKPTHFKTDQILMRVRFEGGTNRIAPDEPVPAVLSSFYDQNGLLRGGLGKLSGTEAGGALNGKSYSINYRLSESYTDINGYTTRDDVLTQAQVLMAFVTVPRFDDVAVRLTETAYANTYKALMASPEGLINNLWWGRIFPGDSRYDLPTPEVVSQVDGAEFTRFMKATLKPRRMEISIVGDISVEEAKAVVTQTFASLPAPPPSEAEPRYELKRSEEKVINFTHMGKAGQAAAMVLWPTEGFYHDLKRSRGLKLLSEVMTLRLNSILREKEGLAYSPYAFWTGSTAYDHGFMRVVAGINPAQEERFFKTLNQITDDLKAKPVSDDELLRARKPLIESRLTDEKDNGFWLSSISAASFETGINSAYKDYQGQMLSFTPQDLQLLAQSYLAADRAITLLARPAQGSLRPQDQGSEPQPDAPKPVPISP